MPVAQPLSPTRPLPEPDWDRWEAELSDTGGGDPPGPPDPPTGGGGDGDGETGGRKGEPGTQGRGRFGRMFVALLACALTLAALIGVAAAVTPGEHGPKPLVSLVPPNDPAKAPSHTSVMLQIPEAGSTEQGRQD